LKLIAEARIRNGRMEFKQRSVFLSDIEKLKDGEYIVSVEKKKKKRSIDQNSYIHALFTLLKDSLNELGNSFTMEQVKEMMKYKFLLVDMYNEDTGVLIGSRIRGTSELTTTELNDFFEKIIAYAADEFGIILPYPNEQLRIEV